MEIIIGALGALCVMLLYDKFKPKTVVLDKVDEREAERQKAYEDHWDNVFNYTPEKAYKKVAK